MKIARTNTRSHTAALAALLLIGLSGCGKGLPTSPASDTPGPSASAAPALSTPVETGEGWDSGGDLAPPSDPVLDGRTPTWGGPNGRQGHGHAYGKYKTKKAKKH